MADSFSVLENEELQFKLLVNDSENDSISVSSPNLPTGAEFNAQTKQFSWTPNFVQSGTYWIIFKAVDEYQAASLKTIKIHVKNANRVPLISEDLCQPQNRQLGRIQIPQMINFYVQASDPDGDMLHYVWRINGEAAGSSQDFQFNSQLWGADELTIEALVFDQQDTSTTACS